MLQRRIRAIICPSLETLNLGLLQVIFKFWPYESTFWGICFSFFRDSGRQILANLTILEETQR